MGTSARTLASFCLCIALVTSVTAAPATSDSELVFTVSQTAASPGSTAAFWLNALNPSDHPITWSPPAELKCRVTSQSSVIDVVATPESNDSASIPAGAFARRRYAIALPAGLSGEITLAVPQVPSMQLALTIEQPGMEAKPSTAPAERGLMYFLKGRRHATTPGYDPESFFKQHIFGYEPFYFIAGTDSPNAKFQISFKYRLLNEQGWLADKAWPLIGFHLAYSQTSLWDWNAESAPFFDSSYRPELLYSWDRVLGGAPTNWFRLDLQAGFQHESNGKAGSDSRSLNIAYFRPTVTFGKDTGLYLKLTPRVWTYVGSLSDNRDMPEYRGYADMRAAVGWKRGLQISALGRIGERMSQGSVTLDATYPLMQPPAGAFSMYLHAQYFTGYGESLIGYQERSDIFRAGISLYR